MASNPDEPKEKNSMDLLQKLLDFRRKFHENKPKRHEIPEKLIWDNIKKVQDLNQILKQVDASDELYPKFAAIQAYYLIEVVLGVQKFGRGTCFFDPPSYLAKCGKLLEPIKFRPEIVWLYNKYLQLKVGMIMCLKNPFLHMQALKCSKVACEKYFRDVNQNPWDLNDIFEHYTTDGKQIVIPTNENLQQLYNSVLKSLLNIAISIDDEASIFKYGLKGLKALYSETMDVFDFAHKTMKVASTFLDRNYFKQTNHLIALSMYKAVEYRRSLPESKRKTCDKMQAVISAAFANYGLKFFYLCLLKKKDFLRAEAIKEELQKIDEPEGLKQYEEQYPREVIFDYKQLKSVLKKTELWIERASELMGNECPEIMEKYQWVRDHVVEGRKFLHLLKDGKMMNYFLTKFDFGASELESYGLKIRQIFK